MTEYSAENVSRYLNKNSSDTFHSKKTSYIFQSLLRCCGHWKNMPRKCLETWFFSNPKTPSKVKKSYEEVWRSGGVQEANVNIIHQEEIFKTTTLVEKKIQCWRIAEELIKTQPSTILEIGSGNGLMTISLSNMIPSHKFIGLELTEEGCKQARRNNEQNIIPEMSYCPEIDDLQKKEIRQPIRFLQGSAEHIPLEDKSIDVCISVLALEQMNPIFWRVMDEIKRVTRHQILLLEPFPIFNKSLLRHAYTSSRAYLAQDHKMLEKIGFKFVRPPELIPSKDYRGCGLIQATVSRD